MLPRLRVIGSCLNMADGESEIVSEHVKKQENESYDAQLDFFSEHFNPLKALQTPGLTPPVSTAKTHDNLSKYESNKKGIIHKKSATSVVASKDVERNWLPHQLPIKTKGGRPKGKSFISSMETVQGPLSLLRHWKNERTKLKIWTRNACGIRGYCLAFVTAFDKHWNLVLENVTEVWTRRKKRKVPALDDIQSDEINTRSANRPSLFECTVIKSHKKTEVCQRFVDQLLIRGEHVAFIVISKNSDDQ